MDQNDASIIIIGEMHLTGTGWLTFKNRNSFPGECPRRFLDSERDILQVFNVPLRRPHLMCVCFLHDFSSAKIFREMWTTLAQIFSAKREEKTEVRRPDGHVEHVCKISVLSLKSGVDTWTLMCKTE